MTCKDVEILLAALAEGVLSDQENHAIESHLRSCASCRKALADLRKTGETVKGLGQVDPPPWLKTRVMARVREEAEQKGFLRKFFYPLHIKVPIQALATVLIAVVAWNVYKTGEPEYKQIVPPAAVQEEQRVKTSGESPNIEKPAPETKRETASKTGISEQRDFAPPAPRREGQTELPKTVIPERAKADEAASVATPGTPGTAAVPVKDGEAVGGVSAVGPSEKKEAMPYPSGQPKQKTRDAAAGAYAAKKQAAPAAAPPALSKAGQAGTAPEMTLRVGNAGEASDVIENEVKRLGGRISEKQTSENRIILTARIGMDRVEALRTKIRSMGDVRESFPDTMRSGAGGDIIRIEIRQD
ncbi:MAG TPA: DUF2275 domain-containing protein [Syntrophales bacterium]|nr:DUF2275 domain-containing protein [Syntrophales bacterium]